MSTINPRIDAPIALSRFVEIRDRLAEILVCEFEEQKNQQTDPEIIEILNNTHFYAERFHPLNESEMIGIALYLFRVVYDNQNSQASRGMHDFFLDIYGRHPATEDADGTNREDGDKNNAVQLQVVITLIRAILEDSRWIRLGFDPSLGETFIEGHEIESIQRTEPRDNKDAGNILMYRVVFKVRAVENTRALEGIPLGLATTTVKLQDTDQGYEYIFDPNP